MADEGYFRREHQFLRDLSIPEIEELVSFMKEDIGNTGIELGKGSYPELPTGFIVGNYPVGLAYAFMDFITKADTKKNKYCGLVLRAETPWENRRKVTEKLSNDVKVSLDKFFESH